jgi:predicted nucleic acid-binding Zn ribbon protein
MAKHNDQIIGDVLKNMVRDMKISPKLHELKIKKFWQEVMGTTINNYTKEIRLRRNKLFITIDSAPLRQELTYGKDKLLKVLNKEIGEDYIQQIVIR